MIRKKTTSKPNQSANPVPPIGSGGGKKGSSSKVSRKNGRAGKVPIRRK